MAQGRVKFFNDQKGFGFITQSDSKKDVFVHYSDIQAEGHKTLVENQLVDFDLVTTDKGLKAQKVVVVE